MPNAVNAKPRIIAQAQRDATQEASKIALSPTSFMHRDAILPAVSELMMNAQYEEVEDSLNPGMSRAAYDIYFDAELARQVCRIFSQVPSDMIPVTERLLERLEINGILMSPSDTKIA